jgi:phosphatidylserine decarboxylase
MIRAAWPYVLVLGALGTLLFTLNIPIFGGLLLFTAVCVGLFFRDPERKIPSEEGLIVAPADGKVVEVIPGTPQQGGHIAIFLSLFNVHVNRSPVDGRVESVKYTSGLFKPAFAGDAGSVNERNTLQVSGPGGTFGVSQIAGLIARRIRCFKSAGDVVARGERIGYIAFGSRTELALPPGADIKVKVGDVVRGGETIVAKLVPASRNPGSSSGNELAGEKAGS